VRGRNIFSGDPWGFLFVKIKKRTQKEKKNSERNIFIFFVDENEKRNEKRK
jgi:hypothetical protein